MDRASGSWVGLLTPTVGQGLQEVARQMRGAVDMAQELQDMLVGLMDYMADEAPAFDPLGSQKLSRELQLSRR